MSERDGAARELEIGTAESAEAQGVGTMHYAGPALSLGVPVQTKLVIGQPGDVYEREADAVADRIMRMPEPSVQRCACGGSAGPDGMCQGCKSKRRLQYKMKGEGPGDPTMATPHIQTDLKIGSVDDRYEQEADQVATQVMRAPQPIVQHKCARCQAQEQHHRSKFVALKRKLNIVQRKCSACQGQKKQESTVSFSKEPDKEVKRSHRHDRVARPAWLTKAGWQPAVQDLPADEIAWTAGEWPAQPETGSSNPVQLTPASLSTGGKHLPATIEEYFENRFHYDFSQVRVHTGQGAHEKADALQAYAFTYGNHIYLGSGQSLSPSFLLAHELTHVIQQTSPQPKQNSGANTAETTIQQETGGQSLVQGDFYWVPIVAKTGGSGLKGSGGMTGNQIEKELEPHLSSWGMKTQVDIPNGNRDGIGLNYVGRADLYKGTPIGIRFKGPSAGDCNGQPLGQVTDKGPSGKSIMNGSSGRPNLSGGAIADVAGAPTEITLGEIKPASKEWIKFGQVQVNNYKEGIKFAWEQTNCTLTKIGNTQPQWPPIKLDNIKQGSHTLPAALKFSAGTTAGSTYSLGIGTFLGSRPPGTSGKGSVADDIGTRITFNPHTDLNPPTPIKGDMYAEIDNKGVLVYFFRPNIDQTTINSLITGRHKSEQKKLETQAPTAFATQIQDKIITVLTAPPHIVTFSWRHGAPQSALSPKPIPVSSVPREKVRPLIQTDRKTATPKKLEDTFDLTDWNTNHGKLSSEFKKQEKTDEFMALKFIHLLYETEEQYKKDGLPDNLGKLPKEETLKLEIGTEEKVSGTTKKKGDKVTKTLPDLYPWMDLWTDVRIKPLGQFRDKFGLTFVTVVNKFTDLRDKIRDKFKDAFKSGASSTAGGKAKIIAKALGKALVQMAKILVPHTTELVMAAIKEGIKKKLERLFDLDPLTTAKETLKQEFNKFIAPLEDFKKGAEAYVKQALETYTNDLTWIGDVLNLSKKVGPIAEAAAIALQCGTPPGWGCLKVLARQLQDCTIEAALNICEVQKQIANLVAALGPLAKLPATLAQVVMDILKKVAPNGLEEIFSEPIPQQSLPTGNEIECEDTPPETSCPGLPLGAGMNMPGPNEDHKAMAKLQEEFGQEKMGGLGKMAEAAGMPDNAPFGPEDAKNVGDKLRDAGEVSAQDMADMASGQAGADVKAKLKPLQEYLEKTARKAVLEKIRQELKKGGHAYRFDEMAKRKMHWLLLKPYRPGPFKNMPALMWNEDIKAAGVVDGEYGKCYDDGKVPLTITRAEMYNEQDQLVVIVTPFHDSDARLQGHTCDTPPPPQPPPPKGGKSHGRQAGETSGGAISGGKSESEAGKGDTGKQQGKAGAASKASKGSAEAQGEASGGGLGVGVSSDVTPGSRGDRVEEAPSEAGGPVVE